MKAGKINQQHHMSDSDEEEELNDEMGDFQKLTGPYKELAEEIEDFYDYCHDYFDVANYLFLFNDKMKFSNKHNFDPEDLSPGDLLELHKLNRDFLFEALCDLKKL